MNEELLERAYEFLYEAQVKGISQKEWPRTRLGLRVKSKTSPDSYDTAPTHPVFNKKSNTANADRISRVSKWNNPSTGGDNKNSSRWNFGIEQYRKTRQNQFLGKVPLSRVK